MLKDLLKVFQLVEQVKIMSIKQIIVISCIFLLAALIYFSPKMAPEKDKADFMNLDNSFAEAKKTMKPDQKVIFDRLEKELNTANASNNEADWITSSNDFLKAARLIQTNAKNILFEEAINGFEKALAINPLNISAKISLGTAYVESSSLLGNPPMKGIALLREVLQKDTANIEANLQLGLFSVTSQQFGKAIDRFKKILTIDSTRIDMYVHLGDTYLAMGEKDLAIESFENYKNRIKDSLIEKDIDKHILKIKTN